MSIPTDTQKLQKRIYSEYGKDKVEAEKERLCEFCLHRHSGSRIGSSHCDRGLLPITSKGESCPYYKEKKEEAE